MWYESRREAVGTVATSLARIWCFNFKLVSQEPPQVIDIHPAEHCLSSEGLREPEPRRCHNEIFNTHLMRPIPSFMPLRRSDRSPLDTRNGGVGDAAVVGQERLEKAVVVPAGKGISYALLLVWFFGWVTDRGW